MRVLLCSSFVPFINGGARFIVEWLQTKLQEHGHAVERIYLPFIEDPETMFAQMLGYRLMDLSEAADRLITFRPPAHVIRHPEKIVWFIHHFRTFYDLWGTRYAMMLNTPPNLAVRHRLMAADRQGLVEAKRLFANSQVVSRRIKEFNGLDSEVLYPPIFSPDRFRCDGYGDEIVYVSRVEHHKRQHLLVQAMAYTRTTVKLRLCGESMNADYVTGIKAEITRQKLANRVRFDDRWIDEDEKSELLARALAVAYLPLDEDSYGYPSLEASHAGKAVITASDSGGVLELVRDQVNGLICEPDPIALAEAMDRLFMDRALARSLGQAARERIAELNIGWDHVIDRLLS